MSFAIALLDEVQASAQGNGAEAVQDCIERGQKYKSARELRWCAVQIEQPKQKRDCRSAYDEDRTQYGALIGLRLVHRNQYDTTNFDAGHRYGFKNVEAQKVQAFKDRMVQHPLAVFCVRYDSFGVRRIAKCVNPRAD